MRFHSFSCRSLLAAAGLLLMQSACEVSLIEGVDPPEGSSGTGTGTGTGAGGAVCGDGLLEPSEQCDDGNTEDGDGCTSDCQLSTGTGGAVCGDGLVEPPSEQCDDGNTEDGDGCTSDCQLSTEAGVCGDGVNQPDEFCDDGNTEEEDWCPADCQRDVITFDLTGYIISVERTGGTYVGPLDLGINIGDPISGFYAFDPDRPDLEGDPRTGIYRYFSFPGAFESEVRLGNMSVLAVHPMPSDIEAGRFNAYIQTVDDDDELIDRYVIGSERNVLTAHPLWISPVLSVTAQLSLEAPSSPLGLTSTALPLEPPDLAHFDGRRIDWYFTIVPVEMQEKYVDVHIAAELTSLERVPNTW
ncbi:DUF4215 domain-containing protein [Sorangium sp. So ce1389]|uniref:DUF4215 domain-containing protein n=1 Tax=Sorangium sp. So ce1389 TaxID=3133336 RepID=UPI003F5D7453